MILTLTANPAVDLNFSADQVAFDARAYLLDQSEGAGGRGINAALVLQEFGASTLAIATSGGKAGERFEKFLRDYGVAHRVVRIGSEIRTNYSITDRQGLTVKLDQKGPMLAADEVERLEQAVDENLGEASWLMLCGSLPPGVPEDFYYRLIEKARRRGVKTLLDADRSPLQHGLEARPSTVAPNQQEAERLLGKALITRSHFQEAARRILEMGAESVILSLGSRGAIVAHAGGIAEVYPPRVDAVCPIGAGDALAAAFVWAMEQSGDYADAARWGVAAGTASARRPGLEFGSLEETRQVYEEVQLKPVA